MVLWIAYLYQEFPVMMGRRGQANYLTNDIDALIDFAVEMGNAVIDHIKSAVSKIGVSQLLVHINSLDEVFITRFVSLVIEIFRAISCCDHMNHTVVALIS